MEINIKKIDRNFSQNAQNDMDFKFYSCVRAPFVINGLVPQGREAGFCRLPREMLEDARLSDNMRTLAYHTSGGRIRFCTDSEQIVVRIRLKNVTLMKHMSPVSAMGADVYSRRAGDAAEPRFDGAIIPELNKEQTYQGCISYQNDKLMREIILHLPLYCQVEAVEIGLYPQARIESPGKYRTEDPVVFYGSSITQGACCSRPGLAYPAILARKLDCDFLNLGFSGNAFGEAFMSEYISTMKMSAFVLDYDYNARSEQYLRQTHYQFYQNVRNAKPELPIIVMSAPIVPPANTTVYEKRMEMSRAIIMDSFVKGKLAGDRNLYFVDGETLLGDSDASDALLDGVHPNDVGFRSIAKRLYPLLRNILYGT